MVDNEAGQVVSFITWRRLLRYLRPNISGGRLSPRDAWVAIMRGEDLTQQSFVGAFRDVDLFVDHRENACHFQLDSRQSWTIVFEGDAAETNTFLSVGLLLHHEYVRVEMELKLLVTVIDQKLLEAASQKYGIFQQIKYKFQTASTHNASVDTEVNFTCMQHKSKEMKVTPVVIEHFKSKNIQERDDLVPDTLAARRTLAQSQVHGLDEPVEQIRVQRLSESISSLLGLKTTQEDTERSSVSVVSGELTHETSH